jgi:hypothetical protein
VRNAGAELIDDFAAWPVAAETLTSSHVLKFKPPLPQTLLP